MDLSAVCTITFIELKPRLLLALALIAGCTGHQTATGPAGFRDIALRELREHPRAEVQDIYKLAYQAAMGPEHMHVDFPMAVQWLKSESGAIPSDAPVNKPAYTVVSPDGSLVRVHLRSFVTGNGNLDSLAFFFVETSRTVKPDTGKLVAYWNDIQTLSRNREIPFSEDTVAAVIRAARASGFPAPAHTRTYRELYRPAYRIVHRRFLERLGISP